MSDRVVDFRNSANAQAGNGLGEEPDNMIQKKWNFLCFLGRIKDSDPVLEYLFSMARGSRTAYDHLRADKKDALFVGGFIDQQGCLLGPFQKIAQACIIQENNPHRYRQDFGDYWPLINFMGGEYGQDNLTPPALS